MGDGKESSSDRGTQLFDNLSGSSDFMPDTAVLTEKELESLVTVRISGDCILVCDNWREYAFCLKGFRCEKAGMVGI